MAKLDESSTAQPVNDGSAPADEATGGNAEMPVNEIVKSAQQMKQSEDKDDGDNRTAWIAAGVGVGIGSAALVAALLYANRDKGKKKG